MRLWQETTNDISTLEGQFTIRKWTPVDILKKSPADDTKKVPCTHEGCKRLFKNSESLRRHKIVHQPKIFECQYCDRAFAERSKLKRHGLVHTGIKPFFCSFPGCKKQFSLAFNMKYE